MNNLAIQYVFNSFDQCKIKTPSFLRSQLLCGNGVRSLIITTSMPIGLARIKLSRPAPGPLQNIDLFNWHQRFCKTACSHLSIGGSSSPLNPFGRTAPEIASCLPN
jgi:hypothetical protein